MPKDTEAGIDGYDSDVIISIPQKFSKNIPKEFDISDIGKIDLQEAEDIAREEIPLYAEDDLIVGSEKHDLTHRKEDEGEAGEPEPVSESVSEYSDKDVATELAIESEYLPPDVAYDDGRTWIPIEELEKIDIEERQWVPLEQIAEEIEAAREEKLKFPDTDFDEHALFTEETAAISSEYEGSELDTIAGEIVHYEEGTSYSMKEANVEEDRELVAEVSLEFETGYDEQFIDKGQKYMDEELDFVHAAIVDEDYSKYIWEIDEYSDSIGVKTISTAVELLGLTTDEHDTIEDMMFEHEFKNAGIYDRHQIFEFEKTGAGEGRAAVGQRNYRYLLPREDSLLDHERASIERDISSSRALIFEEDVEEIRSEFKQKTGRIISGDYQVDSITDITDRVVILNDESDVNRFIQTFPKKKQVNVKTMLKYLNGLFDKLPEEAIKKFADSEYFDLYLKVLNELGV